MKVISFCLWGDSPKYNIGAIRNVELAAEIYPGWICRFHVANTPVDYPPAIKELAGMPNVQIERLDNYRANWGLMLARLNPCVFDNVEYMISRDCDSRLTLREKEAVDEWIDSGYLFHTMHDHPHHSVPILGGMFGIKCQNIPAIELPYDAHDWYITHEERWQVDQDFLTEEVWPLIKDNCMNHDEFYRHLWGGRPFSSPRRGLEFVGATYDENDQINQDQIAELQKYIK